MLHTSIKCIKFLSNTFILVSSYLIYVWRFQRWPMIPITKHGPKQLCTYIPKVNLTQKIRSECCQSPFSMWIIYVNLVSLGMCPKLENNDSTTTKFWPLYLGLIVNNGYCNYQYGIWMWRPYTQYLWKQMFKLNLPNCQITTSCSHILQMQHMNITYMRGNFNNKYKSQVLTT